jgi:hypothetical protein
MTNEFFEKPILNSPYAYPARHWELDNKGQPTQKIIEARRRAEFITPIPKTKKSVKQDELFGFEETDNISSANQRRTYALTSSIKYAEHKTMLKKCCDQKNDSSANCPLYFADVYRICFNRTKIDQL